MRTHKRIELAMADGRARTNRDIARVTSMPLKAVRLAAWRLAGAGRLECVGKIPAMRPTSSGGRPARLFRSAGPR